TLNHPYQAFSMLHGAYMIYAIASQKGGTGKTSTSISLAAGPARRNQRVLLIHTDSQAHSPKVLVADYQKLKEQDTICVTILRRNPLPVHPASIPGLDIVPSHILLSTTDLELTTAKAHREARLKQ